MRNATKSLRLVAVICCTFAVAACTAQPTASRAAVDGTPAASNVAGTETSGGQGGVLVGSGHEATTAGDTTGRGGVFVGSGH
jgi:hypothetical protein